MTHVSQMLQANPSKSAIDAATLQACIEACFDCAQTCTACADACLGEQNTQMLMRCIRLDLDCADVCDTTGRVLSRQTAFDPVLASAVVQACAVACRQCGDECATHAQHGMQHCKVCADSCRRCEEACNQVLSAMSA